MFALKNPIIVLDRPFHLNSLDCCSATTTAEAVEFAACCRPFSRSDRAMTSSNNRVGRPCIVSPQLDCFPRLSKSLLTHSGCCTLTA